MFLTIIFCLLAYCIGSVSSAIIVCRILGLPDPRKQGSKNPGATNVLRIGGKKAAIATLVGDALKGFIPVFIAVHIDPNVSFVGPIMVAVFLGHLYPVFFGFQGGKGVATVIGILFGLSWAMGLLFIITWCVVAFCFRFSSLAALVSAALAPFYVGIGLNKSYAIPMIFISILLFWRHRTNIQRLLNKTEPKMGKKN